MARDFPLFPLALVALPSELVPLHIFEERYKTMIERCLEDETEFGIVWLSDDELKPVGCACLVDRVLERMDDGRLNIVARGTRVFRPAPACYKVIESFRRSEVSWHGRRSWRQAASWFAPARGR